MVVLVAASQAGAAPTVSAELVLDGAPVSGPAPGDQFGQAIAVGGGNAFVVWRDGRDLQDQEIFGARISPDGRVLDPASLRLTTDRAYQVDPAIDFDGTNFLLVYGVYTSGHYAVRAKRLDVTGHIVDATPITVMTTSERINSVSVTHDGSNWFVVVASFGVKGIRISAAGEVVDAMGVTIPVPDYPWAPKAGFNGTDFVVAGQGKAARVSPANVVRDASGVAYPGLAIDMECQSGTCVMVWYNGAGIFAHRFLADGTFADPAAQKIASPTGTNAATGVSIVSTGAGYTAAWSEDNNVTSGEGVSGARFDAALVQQGATLTLWTTASSANHVAAAVLGSRVWVTWHGYNDNSSFLNEIFATRLDATGDPLDAPPLVASVGLSDQRRPSAVFDGTNVFVVWDDLRSSAGSDVVGARLSPTGVLLDGAPIAIGAMGYTPDLAFDGNRFMVTWAAAPSTTRGRLFEKTGVPVGAAFSLGNTVTSKRAMKVGFDGENFQMVWSEGFYEKILWQRATPAGVLLTASPVTIAPPVSSSTQQYEQRLACSPVNCLALWYQTYFAGGDSVSAVLIDRNGGVGAPIFLAGGFSSTGVSPNVTFDGAQYLVSWAGRSLGVARVGLDGGVLDAPGISFDVGYEQTAAFDGTRSLVAFVRGENFSSADLYGRWLGADARPIDAGTADGGPYRLTEMHTNVEDPVLIATSPGHFVLIYSRRDVTDSFNSFRIRARLIAADGAEAYDAGMVVVDAGVRDAGLDAVADAGVDAGPVDAGEVRDSGSVVADASVPDAGEVRDAGPQVVDAGAQVADAGTGTGDGPEPQGCGCSTSPSGLAILAAVLLVRRRLRRRSAPAIGL